MNYDEAQAAFTAALLTGEGVEEAIVALCAAQAPVFEAKARARAADAARKRVTRPLQAEAARLCEDLRVWASVQTEGAKKSAALGLVSGLGRQIREGGTAEEVGEWVADLRRRAALVMGAT